MSGGGASSGHHSGANPDRHSQGSDDDTTPVPANVVVVSETDLMVNAIDTLAHLVGVEPTSIGASNGAEA